MLEQSTILAICAFSLLMSMCEVLSRYVQNKRTMALMDKISGTQIKIKTPDFSEQWGIELTIRTKHPIAQLADNDGGIPLLIGPKTAMQIQECLRDYMERLRLAGYDFDGEPDFSVE